MRIARTGGKREYDGYPLTAEQDHAVDLMVDGGDLRIEAFAGAGKTSTLVAGAREMDGRGLYISFNKGIAEEAQSKFPSAVQCRTAHSLAYGAVGRHYRHRLTRINGTVIADALKLRSGATGLSRSATGMLVVDTINKFTQTADVEVGLDHLPWASLLQIEDKVHRKMLVNQLLDLSKKAWTLMADPNSDVPITHNVYLKLWVMSKPDLKKDFILFDEAQDANPLMLELVGNQDAQRIYVGDRYQQIYSWNGAVNAMQTIKTENHCQLTQSFRFGQDIADLANDILNEHLDLNNAIAIRGFDKVNSAVTMSGVPDVFIARTNSGIIDKLISCQDGNISTSVSGGCQQSISLIKGLSALKNGRKTENRDLMFFTGWDEVLEYAKSEAGTDLNSMIRLCDKYTFSGLIRLLESANTGNKHADLVLTTTHKAKGLEWGNVQLAGDFKAPDDTHYVKEDTNVLYVAATRAKHELNIALCEPAKQARIDSQGGPSM